MNINCKEDTLSPRWGTWFIDWLQVETRGEGWEIWHKEMLSDREWYFDFWEAEQDWYRSASYYADWQESNRLVQLIQAIYYCWGYTLWRCRIAHFRVKTTKFFRF